ncbi:MAG TPA: HD domain-containing phosphohydrolase [Clostridia bacterium]|nr:HD domain-containing phosphohydrolase [Clostridia bacterium]
MNIIRSGRTRDLWDNSISEAEISAKKKANILIVEDEPITANLLQKMLMGQGYRVVGIESTGEKALDKISLQNPDLILMDIQLGGSLDGIEVAQVVHKEFDLPLVYITSHADDDTLGRAKITEPFGYILKPINPRELNMVIEIALYKHGMERKIREDNERTKRILEKAFFDLTKTVCRTLGFRDAYTAGHQERVAKLAAIVGRRMGLGQDDINELYIGGLLHDVGKIGIPTQILNKMPPLTDTELTLIREHPRIGFEILSDAELPWNIRDIVLNHHEKLDGSGYPSGLSGCQISINVRIITVCDVAEAMSTLRPYRAARTKDKVIRELSRGRGIKYDANVVDVVLDLIETGEFNPWK